MTLTTARLASIATELETDAGVSNPNNGGDVGYWKRIALAFEALAGASSSANDGVSGYQLRSVVAAEDLSATTSTAYNDTEPGRVRRIINALEIITGGSYLGTLGVALLDAVTGFVAGAATRVLEDGVTARLTEDNITRILE